MGPIAQPDGHDAPRLIDELIPCVAAMVDDVVIGFEHAVGEPVVAQELPDILGWIEFRAFGRQGHDGDVGGKVELVRHMPAGLIEEQHGVRAGGDVFGDFGEMQVHRIGVAFGQDEGRALAVLGRDRAENIGRGGALILGRGRPRAAFRPAPGELVLLANARLVGEPDFYVARVDSLFPRDFFQACGENFLNSSIAPSRCA
jgi:hypothetical protein